eukprot:Skav226885  [mRNA]  locus=scaffold1187:401188:401778:+ [translate_table: standard]
MFFPPVFLHRCRAEVWGLVFLSFCFSAATQQQVGVAYRTEPLQADLAAMHGLAELSGRTSDNPDEAKRNRLVFVGLFKVVLENVPQLLLQSSFLALVFDELTPLGRAKMLFSILLGLASALQKILEGMVALVMTFPYHEYVGWPGRCCGGFVSFVILLSPFLLAALSVFWTIAKLYFVFHCDTHLWNWGSGCVEWT